MTEPESPPGKLEDWLALGLVCAISPERGAKIRKTYGSLQDAVKALELLQRLLGRFLTVAPGGAERQEELDDLIVQETHEPASEKLLPQPPAVPAARRRDHISVIPPVFHHTTKDDGKGRNFSYSLYIVSIRPLYFCSTMDRLTLSVGVISPASIR